MIDAFVHHHWGAQEELMEYMGRGWREYLGQPSRLPGPAAEPIPVLPNLPYHRPEGDKLPGSAPAGRPAGSSHQLLSEQLLDAHGIERAVLGYDELMLAPSHVNTHLAREVVRAANDWTRERWLEADDRLFALILVPNQTPDDAVAEIERVGDDPRMVGVLMAANGLGKPFGHPIYHGIYRAAAERDLPLVIHAGGDAAPETLTDPMAGGLPSTYAEYAMFRPQALMTHVTTMIGQGVFVKFPSLRVLLVGGGVAWLPSLFWRFDVEFSAYRREAPWVPAMPTEFLRRHVRISTYPLDVTPRPEQLHRLMDAFGDMEELLVYASGYPNWDTDWPADIEDRIRPQWRSRVLGENALEFFRWSAPSAPREQPVTTVGSMDQRIPAGKLRDETG